MNFENFALSRLYKKGSENLIEDLDIIKLIKKVKISRRSRKKMNGGKTVEGTELKRSRTTTNL